MKTFKSADGLTLRATVIGGETAPDDYQVFWRELPIGRILEQPGVPMGRPNWHWGVAIPGRPQPPGQRGHCSDLEECKRRFRAVWAGMKSALTEADIAQRGALRPTQIGGSRNGPADNRNIFTFPTI